jgi:hypothetical protein
MNMLIGYPDVSNGTLIMIVYIVVTLIIRLNSKKKSRPNIEIEEFYP